MRKFDLISMCLKNLTRRKVRTFLTIIGVVVGTSAIVVMISIGLGMKESQKQLLSQMGDLTVIEIYNWDNSKDAVLTDEVMSEILKMEGVQTATPLYRPRNLNAGIYAGKNDRYETGFYNVIGVYPDAMSHFGYEFMSGDPHTPFPVENSVIIGEMADYNLRDTRKSRGQNRVDPWPDAQGNIKPPFVNLEEEKIKLVLRDNQESDGGTGNKKNEKTLTVSGRVKENFNLGYETSRGIIMNIQDLKRLEEEYKKLNKIKPDRNEKQGYEEAKVKVTDIKYIESVEKAIQDMGFSTNSMDSIRKPMEENVNKQQTFLGIIAGVSLFVAALGIANTMLMSIYERTREIGIMKVVGCYVEDIRTIFLMEAGCIGFMGGILGIILSYIISFLMNYFGFSTGMDGGMGGFFGPQQAAAVSIIPPWLVLGALAFSTFIGVASGFYPANRAVKISALTAIKQE